MVTLRKKRKLAAVATENQEEHLRDSQSRNTVVPRIIEDCITQVPEEIEGRLTGKLSQEFRRTTSRTLGTLSKLEEFFLNPQVRAKSETVPARFRLSNTDNQDPNGDCSQNDPRPEVGLHPLVAPIFKIRSK